MAPTLADGSKLIEPIVCDICFAMAYLISRSPHSDNVNDEVHTFQCFKCERQMRPSCS
jgi:hypothetical protein